jgi:hypothetical protein
MRGSLPTTVETVRMTCGATVRAGACRLEIFGHMDSGIEKCHGKEKEKQRESLQAGSGHSHPSVPSCRARTGRHVVSGACSCKSQTGQPQREQESQSDDSAPEHTLGSNLRPDSDSPHARTPVEPHSWARSPHLHVAPVFGPVLHHLCTNRPLDGPSSDASLPDGPRTDLNVNGAIHSVGVGESAHGGTRPEVHGEAHTSRHKSRVSTAGSAGVVLATRAPFPGYGPVAPR